MPRTSCLIFNPPGRVEMTELELPELAGGCALVDTIYSAISPGTETRCLRGQQAGVMEQRCVPGYQAVGRVVEASADTDLKPGDLVFFSRAQTSGGLIFFNGTHAKQAMVREEDTVKISDSLNKPETALAALIGIALHGVRLSRVNAGESVAVIGLGLLGQISARIAQSLGAKVAGFDRHSVRVATAQADGIAAFEAAETLATTTGADKEGYDVIIDATGVPAVIPQAVALARELRPWNQPLHRGSRYVIQGSYPEDFCFNYQQVFMKELSILVPRDQTRQDLTDGLAMLQQRELDLSNLVGDAVRPHDAASVYADLSQSRASRQTAVFDWS